MSDPLEDIQKVQQDFDDVPVAFVIHPEFFESFVESLDNAGEVEVGENGEIRRAGVGSRVPIFTREKVSVGEVLVVENSTMRDLRALYGINDSAAIDLLVEKMDVERLAEGEETGDG